MYVHVVLILILNAALGENSIQFFLFFMCAFLFCPCLNVNSVHVHCVCLRVLFRLLSLRKQQFCLSQQCSLIMCVCVYLLALVCVPFSHGLVGCFECCSPRHTWNTCFFLFVLWYLPLAPHDQVPLLVMGLEYYIILTSLWQCCLEVKNCWHWYFLELAVVLICLASGILRGCFHFSVLSGFIW